MKAMRHIRKQRKIFQARAKLVKRLCDMAAFFGYRITPEGKALTLRNGGIIRAQYLLSGTYDYSEYDSWDDIFEVWAAELGGWDYYAEELPDECITAEESRARLLGEFAAAAVQTSIEECILNDDRFGIAKACGYLE